MVKEFRLIIAGGRDFDDYSTLEKQCDYLLSRKVADGYTIIIVSGKARGADSLGERYARTRGYHVSDFPANWNDIEVQPCKVMYNKFNKPYNALAGHNRNEQMARYALEINGGCVAFHDGKSTGTKNMIRLCGQLGLRCCVIKY